MDEGRHKVKERMKILGCKVFVWLISKFPAPYNSLGDKGMNVAKSMNRSTEMTAVVYKRVHRCASTRVIRDAIGNGKTLTPFFSALDGVRSGGNVSHLEPNVEGSSRRWGRPLGLASLWQK